MGVFGDHAPTGIFGPRGNLQVSNCLRVTTMFSRGVLAKSHEVISAVDNLFDDLTSRSVVALRLFMPVLGDPSPPTSLPDHIQQYRTKDHQAEHDLLGIVFHVR